MIPQGRLSTVPVLGVLLPPEHFPFTSLTNYERGPIAIEDTSQGLLYQNWKLTYSAGNLIATPDIGAPVIVLAVAGLIHVTFTFDQNARISIAYSTAVSSYLYWYDSALGMTTTKDLGAAVITPSIYLDDKRAAESAANDMLLWYTKAEGGGTYELFMLRQRDRFLTEYSMATGLSNRRIKNVGMSDVLRVQIGMGV